MNEENSLCGHANACMAASRQKFPFFFGIEGQITCFGYSSHFTHTSSSLSLSLSQIYIYEREGGGGLKVSNYIWMRDNELLILFKVCWNASEVALQPSKWVLDEWCRTSKLISCWWLFAFAVGHNLPHFNSLLLLTKAIIIIKIIINDNI